MKKILFIASAVAVLMTSAIGMATSLDIKDGGVVPMKKVKYGTKVYNVADQSDESKIYADATNKAKVFFVISKQEYRLYVYEGNFEEAKLLAHYPVCYAKNPENKQMRGDMKTPESTTTRPFHISQIQDASSWSHDFRDGRGSVKAYGNWFMRLVTPGHSGIGIHGSTNNEHSIPGRDSEGCIRLRDADIKDLKTRYAQVGTKVVITPISSGKYEFEKAAEKALGDKYVAPKPGYKCYTNCGKCEDVK